MTARAVAVSDRRSLTAPQTCIRLSASRNRGRIGTGRLIRVKLTIGAMAYGYRSGLARST